MADDKDKSSIPLLEFSVGLCCYLAFIIAIGVILGGSDKNCDNPIREWLIVWVVVNSASICIVPATHQAMISKSCPKSLLFSSKILFLLSLLFNTAWIIVGSVWLYTDDDCSDRKFYLDFHDMWALALAILIISYVSLGSCFLACICLCVVLCVKGKLTLLKAKKAEVAVKEKVQIGKSVETPAEAENTKKKNHNKHVEEGEPDET